MNNLKTVPTSKLVHILCEEENQHVINAIAYELACRIYVPNNSQTTFEELLEKFGYKTIEEEKNILKKN